jgi:rsbT co-antagonist protein RsbR
MAEMLRSVSMLALMQEMALTDDNIQDRKRVVGLEAEDLERIGRISELILRDAKAYSACFFDYLATLPQARPLLESRALVERARQLKYEHIVAMARGEYGEAYVQQRVELGALYGRAGLEPRVFLGAFHHLLHSMGGGVMKQFERTPVEGFEHFMSLEKIAFFDVGIIIDVLVRERERVIGQQQEAIRELSTPVLQIRERLLLLPIIGVIDTQRARLITDGLLQAIRVNRAKVAVMDITGVATIDSKVANHLLQTVSAARLMGAHVIVTGLSAEVAQSLVALGIELEKLNTVGDLQGGVEEAERLLGLQVVVRRTEPVAELHDA